MYVGTNVRTKSVSHVVSVCPLLDSILFLSVLQPPLCCAGSPCDDCTSKNLSYLTFFLCFIVKSVIIKFELICVCYIILLLKLF